MKHIREILQGPQTALSFEFFPPKTAEGKSALMQQIELLGTMNPAYVSVTYGAGGSTQDLSQELSAQIQVQHQIPVVSHLTCVGASKDEISQILDNYAARGIQNIMALRGDKPQGSSHWQKTEGGFAHAAELVAWIKARQPHMGIGVAGFPEGHPECPNRMLEMDYLKAKVDAGADYICTQLFFDNADFFDFRERCVRAGIQIPIVAGIMPLTALASMRRMSELSAGSRFPAKLVRALDRARTEEQVKNIGLHWAASQVQELVDQGCDGIHFYTLNKAEHTQNLCARIGLDHAEQFRV